MSEPLPPRASVVVVGGGIIGCSTLYFLARRGFDDAVLLERKKIASGTTWHAAGIVGQLRESAAQTALGKRTARLFRDLEDETGQATGYRECGTLHLALSEVRAEQLRRTRDRAAGSAIESRLLGVREIEELWPHADTAGVLSGLFVPSNGQVDPLDATRALAAGARGRGARILEDTPATGIRISNGRVAGVETRAGAIETGRAVLACGMWTARFARSLGVPVPLHAAEHFYVVTEPVPDLPRELPALVSIEERFYAREDAGKLLVGGFEAIGKAWATGGIPDTFEFDELPFDMEQAAPVLEAAFDRIPALRTVGIRTFFNGPESFTPDGKPLIGPAPEVPGLFVAAGMNSNGIMNAGGAGAALADWIADGLPRRSVGDMAASRAMPFQSNLAYNALRVRESVGLHWGLQWPGRQTETARGIRRVPLHRELAAAGAKFAERAGWEVPAYFDPASEGWPTRPSTGSHAWSPWVAEEVRAAESAAVLLDRSMCAKILVQGPDAVRALDRVSGARMDVAPGASVRALLLNARGGIEADVTAIRLDEARFLVLTGPFSQVRDAAWIRAHAEPNWRFEVVDMTSAYSLLSVSGPESRRILSELTRDDLSGEALPFGLAREIDLAHARVLAIRRSALGELGFELLLPTEFTAHVHEALIGADPGIRHAGTFALNACRLEKGFRRFGHDMGDDVTPNEAGLATSVDLGKPEFVGREALAAQRAAFGAATPNRLAAIRVPSAREEEGAVLVRNEPVWKDGRIVGHVTSGGWGYRLGQTVGIAALRRDGGVRKSWIEEGGFEVQIAGRKFAAELRLAPFYDPSGARMRG